jgi:DNA invertase Pin-like site-specific DNA recombinase
MNVVGYIRVSSTGQISGDGPQRQEDAIRKFCEAHKVNLAVTYLEAGVSGTVEAMDREAFAAMVAYIENKKDISAVVVERLDRLARDLMVSEILLTELRKRGIKVFSADQGALIDMANDEVDPTRKLIRQIIAALAEWEKSQLVLKLRVARERKRKLTGRCEGVLPYGRTGAERATLETIRQWQRQKMSLTDIVYWLNKGGIKTRMGREWTKNNLNQMLRNQP